MPYQWTSTTDPDPQVQLSLWPHRSLPRRGFTGFILITFGMITIPLFPLLGTVVLWGLLPFLLLALAGVWWGLERSYRDARISERLTIGPTTVCLCHTNPKGQTQEWTCNRYWARLLMHPTGGPVDHYLTFKGGDREVEIGAFISEDERKALYGEISDALRPESA